MAKMFRKFTSSIVLGAALLAVVGLAPMAEGDKAKNNGLAANERSLAKPAMLPEYYYNPIASKFHYIKRFCEDVCFLNTDLRNTFDLNNGGNNEDVNFGGGFVLILQQNDDEEFNENRLETMEEFLEKIRLFGYIRKILNIYDVREVCRCGAPPVKGERPNDMASKVSLVKRSYPLLTAQAEQDEGKPPHGYNFLPSNAPWNKNFMTNLRLDGRELSENKQKIWAGYVRNLLKKHSELKPQLKDASNNHTEQHLQPPPTSEEDDGVQRAAEDVKPAVARRSDNALGDDDAALSLDPTFQFSWLKHNPLEAEGMRYKKKNPFDKEGIRFKRSVFLFHQYPFGREGIRFKKSPFEGEGIRFKKSPFEDEGIRFKRTPFEGEGIRFKKSPFEGEGIRFKKSPFEGEGIRFKKSPFEGEGIRFKKSPFEDEGIRFKKAMGSDAEDEA